MSDIQTKSPLTLKGTIDSVDLLDSGADPNTVISTKDKFTVKTSWTVTGTAVPFLGGEWVVRALVESIGEGFEGQIGTETIAVNGGNSYTSTIEVPAGKLPSPATTDDTVYKLVVLVSHRQFGTKTAIAGFGDSVYFEIQG